MTVLTAFTMKVPSGTVAMMGPSGSGKSSLLRCFPGFQTPSRGTTLDDVQISANGDARAAVVFQDHRLIEFLSVGENLALAAELKGARVTARHVEDLLAEVGLSGYGPMMPSTLSGGQA